MGQEFRLYEPLVVERQLGFLTQASHGPVVTICFLQIVRIIRRGVDLTQQGRVRYDKCLLVQTQQNVELLRHQRQTVVYFLQGQAVVGQLQLAAQHVVVGDEALPFLALDVFKALG